MMWVFRALAQRGWLVVVPVALAALIGVGMERGQPPPRTGYAVTLRFLAGIPPEKPGPDFEYARHYAWLASEYTARSFTSVVMGTEFAAAVAARATRAGQPTTRDQVAAAVLVNPPDSFKLVVRVEWPESAGAVAIAEAITAELDRNGNAYWPQLAGSAAPPVQRLDVPVAVPVVLSPPRNPLEWPIRLVIAALAGMAVALISAAIHPALRTAADAAAIGLPLLAEIPGTSRGLAGH